MTRIIIRGVPSRAPFLAYLGRHLPDAEIFMDPDYANPRLDGRVKSTAHFCRALDRAGLDPCIHMEEDVVLTRDFRAKVESAIAERPDKVIQFFSIRKADMELGSRWDRKFSMNQCFYLPAGHGPLLLGYIPTWMRTHNHPGGYDMAMCDWLRERKESYWIHVPSLVQHRVTVSLINPRRSSRRQSPSFVDPVS